MLAHAEPRAGRAALTGLDRAGLASWLEGEGVPDALSAMRARQLFHWLYARGANQPGNMTTLPKDLRALLQQRADLARPRVSAERRSEDGTRKWLLRLADGREV